MIRSEKYALRNTLNFTYYLYKGLKMNVQYQKPSSAFVGASWFSVVLSIALLLIGLFNAELLSSEKGFYGMSFLMALFGAVAVQKNIRDIESVDRSQSNYKTPADMHDAVSFP